VINRRGWVPGNDLALLLIATPGGAAGTRKVWSVDGSSQQRAYLVIEYTPKPAGWGTKVALPMLER